MFRTISALRTTCEAEGVLTLGVLGEVRVSGSRLPAFESLEAWQLGAVWFNEEKK